MAAGRRRKGASREAAIRVRGAAGRRMQHAELDDLVGSQAASAAMSENSVGLPLELSAA